MSSPVGAVVRFYYDSVVLVRSGDAVQTPTGRIYCVLKVRVQERGKHVGRQHMTAIVASEIPSGVRVHRLVWYRRERKRHARPAQHSIKPHNP